MTNQPFGAWSKNVANFSVEPISLDERPGRRRLQSVNEMDREGEGS